MVRSERRRIPQRDLAETASGVGKEGAAGRNHAGVTQSVVVAVVGAMLAGSTSAVRAPTFYNPIG